MSEFSSIRISGSGSCGGGCYNEIRISGSGKVTGDVKCNEISVSGSGRIEGRVDCLGKIGISGSGVISGDIHCSEFRISGATKAEGNISAQSVHSSGSLSVGGWINADEIVVSGAVSARGDISGERITISGGVKTEKLISGQNVEIRLGGYNGQCCIGEIGGGNIMVTRRADEQISGFFGKLFRNNRNVPMAKIGSIEADNIDVSYSEIDKIVGARVKIGPCCEVERVEYTESLEVDESSTVKETVKSGNAAQ